MMILKTHGIGICILGVGLFCIASPAVHAQVAVRTGIAPTQQQPTVNQSNVPRTGTGYRPNLPKRIPVAPLRSGTGAKTNGFNPSMGGFSPGMGMYPGMYQGGFPGMYPGSYGGMYPGSYGGNYPGMYPGSYGGGYPSPYSYYPGMYPY